jgi:glycosyltransferase involved in cell wall biosynthesis
MKIAAFGFRSVPLREGCAGADKFAMELLPRLAAKGHQVTGYNRLYPGQERFKHEYSGVRLYYFKTVRIKGFDTILHSFQCTMHILLRNTAQVVHIQNGGNSIWALFLRLAGKKVFISQDGIDWNREKWPWYGRTYLKFSAYLTASIPNRVIFDNIFARESFEKRFRRKFDFIPFGSDVPEFKEDDQIFKSLGIEKNEYFLFIGRFIPDKGLHYLIPAFHELTTKKKLVLVGGSPNPSNYEKELHIEDDRVVFAGYIYGDDSMRLIRHAYCYVQPSDVEGLSPVILNVMGLGTPIICSDIPENVFAVENHAILFRKGNIKSLKDSLQMALDSRNLLDTNASLAKQMVLSRFNWDKVAQDHISLFTAELAKPKFW